MANNSRPKDLIISNRILAIGRYLFQLASADAELLRTIESMFVPFENSWAAAQWATDSRLQNTTPDVINLDRLMQNEEFFQLRAPEDSFLTWKVMGKMVEHHLHFRASDAAVEGCVLMTPNGTTVIICGQSMAGKSTLTVALAAALKWKVVSEDFVFFDREFPYLIPLVAPISLRQGAAELIEAATGTKPGPLVASRWIWAPEIFQTQNLGNGPISSILLKSEKETATKFQLSKLTWAGFLRSIIPISNAHTIPNGVTVLEKVFEKSDCQEMTNGTLEQRINALRHL